MYPQPTSAQKLALKTAILADSTLASAVAAGDDPPVADAFNAQAVPTFTVWKSIVSLVELGNAFVSTELAGLTTANTGRLQAIALYSPNGINPALVDRRQAFDDIFSGTGGVNTRANLLTLYKRTATRAEKVLAIGTGSDASPATLTAEGPLSPSEVSTILRG